MDYTDTPYVIDLVTSGDDAVDVAWDLASGQADVEADTLVWDDDRVMDEFGELTDTEPSIWLEEVTAP